MQCWTLPPVPSVWESVTNAPPACAMTSRSPVASTTTLARIALRPCLLSKIAPRTCVAVGDRRHDPRVQQDPHAGADEHLVGGELQPLRVDHRGLADRVAERRQALAPVGDLLGVRRAPELGARTRDSAFRQAIEKLGADARDDLRALPVGHPVDPDDETTGRQPAEIAVALDDRDALPEAPGGDRGRRTGGAAADDEHVGLLVDGRLARRLGDRCDGRGGGGRGGRCVLVAPCGEPGVPAGEVALRVGLALCSVSFHHPLQVGRSCEPDDRSASRPRTVRRSCPRPTSGDSSRNRSPRHPSRCSSSARGRRCTRAVQRWPAPSWPRRRSSRRRSRRGPPGSRCAIRAP